MKSMKVLLDTNFLLVPFQFKVDLYEDIQKFGKPMTLDSCIRELETLARRKTKSGLRAKAALILLRVKSLKIEKTPYSSDTAVIEYSNTHSCAVATNDRKLIKRLKSNGIRIIRLRQKRLLTEE